MLLGECVRDGKWCIQRGSKGGGQEAIGKKFRAEDTSGGRFRGVSTTGRLIREGDGIRNNS